MFIFAKNFRPMKKYLFLLIVASMVVTLTANAQTWKRSPSSIVYGNGTNHFMGDLGGGKKSAAHFFGVRDLDYQVTRPTWQIGYRYRFHSDNTDNIQSLVDALNKLQESTLTYENIELSTKKVLN